MRMQLQKMLDETRNHDGKYCDYYSIINKRIKECVEFSGLLTRQRNSHSIT